VNLFTLHNEPDKLLNYNRKYDLPEFAYERLKREHARMVGFTNNSTLTADMAAKLENTVSKSAQYSYFWATLLQGRFEAGEEVVAESTKYAYLYAKFILKGRWPKAEHTFAKSDEYSFRYAKYILNNRFEAG